MERVCLAGATTLTPFREIDDSSVIIEGPYISWVGRAEGGRPRGCHEIDLGGLFVAPGFIDLHVHGGGGYDVMEGTVDALEAIAISHARGGTTGLLGTTLTAPVEEIGRALQAVEEASELDASALTGARVLGAHVEGPYFHPEQVGAQNPAHLRNPDVSEFESLLSPSQAVKRVSLAPELPGALELARALAARNILVSIAHSNATYQQVVNAVEAGFSHVTHIYSGMSSIRRVNAYRVAGVLEAALLLDELTTEVIADGHHLPPSLLRLVLKVKGSDRVCAVTDAIAAAGLGPGEYELGGLRVIVEDVVAEDYEVRLREGDCVAKLADRSAFAGSAATMNRVVGNLVRLAGLPLSEAVKMATWNPARIMGIAAERGVLAPGRVADVVAFDHDLNVKLTMVEGRIVFQA